MKRLHILLAAMAISCAPGLAAADYPDRPIRLVVPFAPGGNIDATARAVSQGLSERLGQTVVVENRGGAGGVVGADYVARSAADGYVTLLGSTGALASLPALRADLPFDPVKDFRAAGAIARVPLVLVVNPKLPFNDVAELIAYAKENPGRLTMGSAGTGTSNHLTGELFQSMSGTKFLHVPYKGSGQALTDLMGGQVDLMFDQLSSSLPMIAGGKLKALGVTTLERSSVRPDLPTLHESGLKDFEASTTAGILFPAATPDDVVEKFSKALRETLAQEATVASFRSMGADVVPGRAEDFDGIMAGEAGKWSRVVNDANIKLER